MGLMAQLMEEENRRRAAEAERRKQKIVSQGLGYHAYDTSGMDPETAAAVRRVQEWELQNTEDAAHKRGRHKSFESYIFAGLSPYGMEQQLLDKVGLLQYQELAKMSQGKLFELDESTRKQLDRIQRLRGDTAERAVDYGLDQAAGSAASGSAARGLPRGSLRAELMARMSGPVLQRYQDIVNQIGVDDANLRIQLPRSDAAFRQQVLQAPGLTALQRSRLATAELRLRFRGQNIQKEQIEAQRNASKWGAIGKTVGAIGAIAAAPFTGGASLAALPAIAGVGAPGTGSYQANQMAQGGLQYGYGTAGTGGGVGYGGGYGYVPQIGGNQVQGGSLTGLGPSGPGWR